MTGLRNDNAGVEPGGVSTPTKEHDTNHIAEKAFFTLQAKFAILGHVLYRVNGSNGAIVFLVTRWGLTREVADMAAVCAFYLQIGGTL